ncbi:Ger(x)C family spore germination C-terminal domain-containing protein [Ammoniphilus sp. CFH 90114]|uniref:Ger(x)C family spore germination protein n=1 Tax=Ammoniphilus sp. CFH 90114 TaxID=2493665 RepID=UPI00100E87D5|nr:Ger(x)C family spore germination C-terminal domain-containing protein [Ammoniphilus sp. CFH 90114]RXT13669.1 spore gernimation protein [Ammoniphilus sp. CFH 90114]
MIKRIFWVGALISIIWMTGCSPFVENNTIEEIAPVIFWSIREGKEGKLEISTLAPPLIKEQKRLLTREVTLLKESGKEFNLIYYRELKSGQLRMLFIEENLAKKGISPIINTILTDPDISQRLFLVIVKGNVEDYIKSQLDKQPDLDYFLYRMLRHYEKEGEITAINLHQYKEMLYAPYADPILPVFKVNSHNFTYDGTALFQNDRFITSILHMDDNIFQLISNNHFLKILPIPSLSVSLGKVRSKVHMELNQDNSALNIEVQLNGRIEEYRGDRNILQRDPLADLNNDIESYLETQTTALIKNLQKQKMDPLQIGTLTLSPFSKPISEEEWLRQWEHMKIHVDYQVHIQPLTNVME